jgi:hypothetical protein
VQVDTSGLPLEVVVERLTAEVVARLASRASGESR